MSLTRFVLGEAVVVDPTAPEPTDPTDQQTREDTVDKHCVADLIYAYEAGENVNISGLPEPTQRELRAKRALQEEGRRQFEAGQAAQAAQREQALRLDFLAAGGSDADWQREKSVILAEDRKQTVLGNQQREMYGDLLRQSQ